MKVLTAAFVLAVVLLCCRAPRTERQGWRFAAECGLIVLGMLLFSERTWKHHAVTLLIPAAALAYSVTLDLPERVRRFVVGALVAALLLMTLPGLFGTRGQDLALVYGTHTAAFLLLAAATGLVLARALRGEKPAGFECYLKHPSQRHDSLRTIISDSSQPLSARAGYLRCCSIGSDHRVTSCGARFPSTRNHSRLALEAMMLRFWLRGVLHRMKQSRRRSTPASRFIPELHPLGERIVPAVVAFVSSPGNLMVVGDSANNTITVSRTPNGTIQVNGAAVPFGGGVLNVAQTAFDHGHGRPGKRHGHIQYDQRQPAQGNFARW